MGDAERRSIMNGEEISVSNKHLDQNERLAA